MEVKPVKVEVEDVTSPRDSWLERVEHQRCCPAHGNYCYGCPNRCCDSTDYMVLLIFFTLIFGISYCLIYTKGLAEFPVDENTIHGKRWIERLGDNATKFTGSTPIGLLP